MFDDLSRNLEKAWDMVRKDGKLTKENIKEPMREIRRALLEADVRLSETRLPWKEDSSQLMHHHRTIHASSTCSFGSGPAC